MIDGFKATCYAILLATYVYLNWHHLRNIYRKCNNFSMRKYLQTDEYVYRPVDYHWFFKKTSKSRQTWCPFSKLDSLALERSFASTHRSIVATDGGRYDVDIFTRKRYPVYWESPPCEIRRSSWFYKHSSDEYYTPYEEDVSMLLEHEFQAAVETKQWYRKVVLINGDVVELCQPNVLLHHSLGQSLADTWGETFREQVKPGIVKRGTSDFALVEGESATVDHLLLIVHGIGSACDLKLRTIEEVVDEFRDISAQLLRSHFAVAREDGLVHRLEVLPINWHTKLHSVDTGIDEKLKRITLPSVPLLRDFINDTLSDIFLYKSPKYCQTILTTVGSELNRIYDLFKKRNPTFRGDISLGGHSLGSVILFDLLCHQSKNEHNQVSNQDMIEALFHGRAAKPVTPRISSLMVDAGVKPIRLEYPKLQFQPSALFSLGSPIALFVTTAGLDQLGCDFTLPTCPAFFNIFHPYDPVANRIETLVNPKATHVKPALLPHHNGGKRIHLQIKEMMSRVTTNLKNRVTKSMKNTRNKLLQMRMAYFTEEIGQFLVNPEITVGQNLNPRSKYVQTHKSDLCFGMLNKGRRIDYVLQEAPIESFNEYLFALTLSSHLCYWRSKDTMLLIMKEIYGSMNIFPDHELPKIRSTEKVDKSGLYSDDSDADSSTADYFNPSEAPLD